MTEFLDLDFENTMKEFFLKHKQFSEKDFSAFWEDYKTSPIVEDIRCIFEIWKERVKSKFAFYLRYKDNPKLLANEQPEEYSYLRVLCPSYEGEGDCKVDHTLCTFPRCVWFSWKDIDLKEYNYWLFRKVFGSVFSKEEAEEIEKELIL